MAISNEPASLRLSSAQSLVRDKRPSADIQARASALAVILLFFGFADALTTEATLLLNGGYETNPIIVWLRDQLGQGWILPKMIGHGVLAWLTVRGPTPSMLLTMTALSITLLLVTSNNFSLMADAVAAETHRALQAVIAHSYAP